MKKENDLKIIEKIVIAYPSGNTTALIFDDLNNLDRRFLNQRIMSTWKKKYGEKPEIEQCCFVSTEKSNRSDIQIEMFGGEFCGNALRSAIKSVRGDENYSGLIEISGFDDPLNYNIEGGEITVEMPTWNYKNKLFEQVDEGTLVFLDGIVQLVVDNSEQINSASPKDLFEKLYSQNKYGLKNEKAVGISFYEEDTQNAEFCVWVKEVNTIFDETACGSGTCAIGIAQSVTNNRSEALEVKQPSNQIINTRCEYDPSRSKILFSEISGEVEIIYEGEMKLS